MKKGDQILNELHTIGLMKVTDVDADTVNGVVGRTVGWKKRSIFWDLPYWNKNLVRHNLDVMHVEKNVFDNLFNTVMNIQGKMKDTTKSRDELNEYCDRPNLKKNERTRKYSKVSYVLDKESK